MVLLKVLTLLPPFNSLLAKSYAGGFVVSPLVDVAEGSEVTPTDEIWTVRWLFCSLCRSSLVFVGLLKIIRNSPASTLAIAFNALWRSELLTEMCLAEGGCKRSLLCPCQSSPHLFPKDRMLTPPSFSDPSVCTSPVSCMFAAVHAGGVLVAGKVPLHRVRKPAAISFAPLHYFSQRRSPEIWDSKHKPRAQCNSWSYLEIGVVEENELRQTKLAVCLNNR